MKLLKVLALALMAIASTSAQESKETDLPRILIIGNSISIGYTKPLKTILAEKAEAFHHQYNLNVNISKGNNPPLLSPPERPRRQTQLFVLVT